MEWRSHRTYISKNFVLSKHTTAKFTAGPTGVEYTMQLNAFDLLHVELVHGWLADPSDDEYELLGDRTYNQLINEVIRGSDASGELTKLQQEQQQSLIDLGTTEADRKRKEDLGLLATQGTLIQHYLERTGHQLTQFGLHTLFEYVKEGAMVVFFRNNHFNTLTKHDGMLYLLVTDLGYATVDIVWEKLDVIDGDTEYVKSNFKPPPPMPHHVAGQALTGDELAANNVQSQADYQLALQLSRETAGSNTQAPTTNTAAGNDSDYQLALQLSRQPQTGISATTATIPPTASTATGSSQSELDRATRASLEHYHQEQSGQMPTRSPPSNGSSGPALPAHSQTPMAVAATGVPMTSEEADRMLAIQLDQEGRGPENRESLRLAKELQRQERERQRERVGQAGPPPRPIATASNSNANSNCVIS